MSDLAEWKIPDTRFYYWNSLKSFIDKYAKTKFDVIEDREVLVAEIEKNEAGFLTPVQEYISSKVIGCSLEGYDVFVPGDNEILKEIQSDVGAQIDEVSELDNDKLLLGITIDSIGVVTSTLSISDIKEIEEYDLDVEVVDRDNGACKLETTLGIQVKLRAVYSKNRKAVISVEIDDIDDYNCPYCPY